MTHNNPWVVIPSYNEASALNTVLGNLSSQPYSVVVVDDGSRDNSAEVAQMHPVHYCKHRINLGQGAALQTGIEYALQNGASHIVTFDADGQHEIEGIARLLAAFDANTDVVLGSRFVSGGKAHNIAPMRKLLLQAATSYTRLTTGLRITDTHNGLRAFSASAARKIRITQNRMAHASEILSQIAELKLRYKEIPVTIHYTEYSLQKGQKMSNSFNILWESITGVLRR